MKKGILLSALFATTFANAAETKNNPFKMDLTFTMGATHGKATLKSRSTNKISRSSIEQANKEVKTEKDKDYDLSGFKLEKFMESTNSEIHSLSLDIKDLKAEDEKQSKAEQKEIEELEKNKTEQLKAAKEEEKKSY